MLFCSFSPHQGKKRSVLSPHSPPPDPFWRCSPRVNSSNRSLLKVFLQSKFLQLISFEGVPQSKFLQPIPFGGVSPSNFLQPISFEGVSPSKFLQPIPFEGVSPSKFLQPISFGGISLSNFHRWQVVGENYSKKRPHGSLVGPCRSTFCPTDFVRKSCTPVTPTPLSLPYHIK